MANELNSEIAMAFLIRARTDEKFDQRKMLTILNQVHTTLRPLSKADRREKTSEALKSEERAAAGNH